MWWQYIIIAAIIVLGIYGFLVMTRFETWNLSRRTTRTAQDVYPSYADSLRKQRQYARQHGLEWTSDDGGQPREPEDTRHRNTARPPLAGPPAVRLSPLTRSTAAKTAAISVANYRRKTTGLEHRPRRQPLLDKSGRFAHYYGSESWGFESLRARHRCHRSGPCHEGWARP